MKNLAMILFLIGANADCATNGYDLKIDLSLDGKHVSSPHMIVKAGESATATLKNGNKENFIEVVANEERSKDFDGILIQIAIGTIEENGKRTIISRPQILTKENEPVQISIGEKNGAEEVALSVIAQRKEL
jgi:type II secretory pathway component GspD/PulD (secretin)